VRRRRDSEPPLRVGGVLSKTLSAWVSNLPAFLLISAVLHAPIVWVTAVAYGSLERLLEMESTWQVVLVVGAVVIAVVGTSIYAYGVVQRLRGRPAGVVPTVARGFARLPSGLATGLLATLVTVLPLAPGLLLALSGDARVGATFIVFLGTIGMVVLTTFFWVAVPVAVIEGGSPFRCMARSAALTKGSRLRIFGVLLVLGIADRLVDVVIQAGADADTFEGARLQVWLMVATMVAVFSPLQSIAAAVGYHDLRVGKEGADVEDLARVFE
jgi:hypothetical protein